MDGLECRLTKHDLRIEIVHELGDELALNGDLMSQHAQVVAELGVLCDDDAQTGVLKLRPPCSSKNLLDIQHACRQNSGSVLEARQNKSLQLAWVFLSDGNWRIGSRQKVLRLG